MTISQEQQSSPEIPVSEIEARIVAYGARMDGSVVGPERYIPTVQELDDWQEARHYIGEVGLTHQDMPYAILAGPSTRGHESIAPSADITPINAAVATDAASVYEFARLSSLGRFVQPPLQVEAAEWYLAHPDGMPEDAVAPLDDEVAREVESIRGLSRQYQLDNPNLSIERAERAVRQDLARLLDLHTHVLTHYDLDADSARLGEDLSPLAQVITERDDDEVRRSFTPPTVGSRRDRAKSDAQSAGGQSSGLPTQEGGDPNTPGRLPGVPIGTAAASEDPSTVRHRLGPPQPPVGDGDPAAGESSDEDPVRDYDEDRDSESILFLPAPSLSSQLGSWAMRGTLMTAHNVYAGLDKLDTWIGKRPGSSAALMAGVAIAMSVADKILGYSGGGTDEYLANQPQIPTPDGIDHPGPVELPPVAGGDIPEVTPPVEPAPPAVQDTPGPTVLHLELDEPGEGVQAAIAEARGWDINNLSDAQQAQLHDDTVSAFANNDSLRGKDDQALTLGTSFDITIESDAAAPEGSQPVVSEVAAADPTVEAPKPEDASSMTILRAGGVDTLSEAVEQQYQAAGIELPADDRYAVALRLADYNGFSHDQLDRLPDNQQIWFPGKDVLQEWLLQLDDED